MVSVVLASDGTDSALDSFTGDPVTVLNAFLILIVAYLVGKVISASVTVIADRYLTKRFRVTLLIPVLKFLVYGVSLWIAVTLLFDFQTAQLVAFSGLLGAALGLGLKDLLADVVGGLVLVAEQPYQIGDKVAIGDHYGEVRDIGIRSTQLMTPTDTLVSVPNYVFFNESIANANAGRAEMLVTVEFYIDPESDARAARTIVQEALISSQYLYLGAEYPVEVHLADDLHYRTVTGKAYINDLRNEERFKTDVTDRVFKEFGRRGIESPKVPAGVEADAME